jgi:hypothetical protein
LLACAKDRGQQIEVVELPGGEPMYGSLPITPDIRKAVLHRGKTVPMGEDMDKDLACLPWASIVTLTSNGKDLAVMTGPAKYSGQWLLPVFAYSGNGGELSDFKGQPMRFRCLHGLEPHVSESDVPCTD